MSALKRVSANKNSGKNKGLKTAEITIPITGAVATKEVKNAGTVFSYALNSVNKFYAIYQKERSGSAGTSSHQEQDLLRAMLVFSCSGLDAVVKQLIKDALPKIIEKDEGAHKEFQKFVERRLGKTQIEDKEKNIIDTTLLAQILVSKDPRHLLVLRLTKHLTDDSLQSKDQLLKVASYFAITADEVLSDQDTTKQAFETRNNIIHEMDVDFSAKISGQKKRRQRSKDVVIGYCENILLVASKFINVVSEKMK